MLFPTNPILPINHYPSPLHTYLYKNHLASPAHILLPDKRDNYFFTTVMPHVWINCHRQQGYPYVEVPQNILHEEIEVFFDSPKCTYKQIVVRFGDTHSDLPIPKLAQMRNVVLADSFVSLYQSVGAEIHAVYGIGDVGRRVNALVEDNVGDCPESGCINRYLFDKTDGSCAHVRRWEQLSKNSVKVLSDFLPRYFSNAHTFLLDSQLLQGPEKLMQILKKYPLEKGLLRSDGSYTYRLNELLWLEYLAAQADFVISFVGSNQRQHVQNMSTLLQTGTTNIPAWFFLYGKCENALSRNEEDWTCALERVSCLKSLPVAQKLQVLFVGTRVDTLLDFENQATLKKPFEKINYVLRAAHRSSYNRTNESRPSLLKKLALLNTSRRNAALRGEPALLFEALVQLARLYLGAPAHDIMVNKALLAGMEFLALGKVL